MNRLLALLLIPCFVVGNPVSHSHADGVAPTGHTGQAHIHVRDHNHGDHSHHGATHHHRQSAEKAVEKPLAKSRAPQSQSVHDHHDSDAVYLQASDIAAPAGAAGIQRTQAVCVDILIGEANSRLTALDRRSAPVAIFSGLPIFLLHAALRL